MIQCLSPITLKSGLVVPCGKCITCLSHRRDEWSHRLQLHSFGYDRMPLFVGLTYDDEHLTFANGPTLVPNDFRKFVKRLKENFMLYDSKFSYFGCGEYGDKYGRPHYHMLFFGFDALSDMFEVDWFGAHQLLREHWQLGNVDIGRAEWSGVHYVTKYVLKYDGTDYEDVKPFLVASHGIGLPWLDTDEAKYLKFRINKVFHDGYKLPALDFSGNYSDFIESCRDALSECLCYFPRLVAHTPQGNEIPLPRYLRQKLIGSFEHFKDNPFWFLEFLQHEVASFDYLMSHHDYDKVADKEYWRQILDHRVRKIRQRMYYNTINFRNETVRYRSRPEARL